MSAIEYVSDVVYPAAIAMLPEKMSSREAKAMVLAIGLQESGFEHRAQVGGPAEGFWQFEEGGGWKGVVNHPQTAVLIRQALASMSYGLPDLSDYYAVENNDILACIMARLLLWTHPDPLPQSNDPASGWRQYQETWRSGKPRREVWDSNFQRAWKEIIE